MSLQAVYNDIINNLHLLCRGLYGCLKCKGTGQRLDRTEDWGEPTYYTCTACKGTGHIPCGGWIITDLDTIHQCPMHYNNQPHPED